MSVTIKDVEHIAKLAKLKFSDEEMEKLQVDLNKVLSYIDKLNELNLNDVEPLENINSTENIFREDETKPGVKKEEALKNAPSKTKDYFEVPKVLDK